MGEIVCPYCKEGLNKYPQLRCTHCNTRHHQICWTENENHCAVFSCVGNSAIRGRNRANQLLIIWCLFNYGLHLALRFVGELMDAVPVADLWIVLMVETFIVGSGFVVIRLRASSEAIRTFGQLLFACNALFLSLLSSHYVAYGFERLNAVIRL